MSKRGATWKGKYNPRFDQKIRSRRNQRNRKIDDKLSGGQLADFPKRKLEHLVACCKKKVAHKSYGAAMAAKLASDEEYGVENFVYECPICGKWHLTTHPWEKE